MSEMSVPTGLGEGKRRFVVLAHSWPQPHFDLMFEWHGVLKTWRMAELPRPGHSVPMEAVGDHRLAYLDYEGPVSGGRGEVKRVDRGVYDGDLGSGDRKITVIVHGQLFQGTWQLIPLSEKSQWELRWLAPSATAHLD